MLSDTTKEWLEFGECDDDGIPACVTKHGEGIYSFELLKPKYNGMWMQEIENMKQFLEDYQIP